MIKYGFLFFLMHTICMPVFCQKNTSKAPYKIPDSINAVTYFAELKITGNSQSKNKMTGVSANEAAVGLAYNKGQKIIHFRFFDKQRPDVAFGKDAYKYGHGNAWNYDWKENETYSLLIATASDSAANKTLYSGYIYLPTEKKWKLIAARSYDDTTAIKYIGNSNDKKATVTQADISLLQAIYQHFVFDVMGLKKEEETGKAGTALESVMNLVLDLRSKAKLNKDFTTSDEIRNKLTEAKIQVKDGKEGVTWSI